MLCRLLTHLRQWLQHKGSSANAHWKRRQTFPHLKFTLVSSNTALLFLLWEIKIPNTWIWSSARRVRLLFAPNRRESLNVVPWLIAHSLSLPAQHRWWWLLHLLGAHCPIADDGAAGTRWGTVLVSRTYLSKIQHQTPIYGHFLLENKEEQEEKRRRKGKRKKRFVPLFHTSIRTIW